MNATYITLIPKRVLYQRVSDYRLISLTSYQHLQNSTIAIQQSTFIQGRQIINPILVVNEILDHRHCSKRKGFVIKLDIEKACNKVNWGTFLLSMLGLKGLHDKWIKWMCACISTANCSILLNGKPRGYLHASRGIRQGNPRSPFLFIIAIDYFTSYNMRNNKRIL